MKISSFLNMGKISNKSAVNKKTEKNSKTDFDKLGLVPSKENKKIFSTLKESGVEPTKEIFEDIKNAFSEMDGSLDEKLDSLKVLLNKEVDITKRNIKLVHLTLNKEIDFEKLMNTLKDYFEKEEIDFEKLLDKIGFSEKVIDIFSENILKNISVKDNLAMILENDKNTLTEKEIEKIEKIIKFDDTKDKKNITEEKLEKLENDLKIIVEEIVSEVPKEVEPLIKSESFRKFIVKETNDKIIEVTKEFNDFKAVNIEKIDKLITDNQKVLKEDIQKVINNFEKIIMKSDISLYTSMEQEKDLIKMASDLELAKEKVSKDNVFKAKEILKEIKIKLEKIDFKPKDVKVKVFMKEEVSKILFNKKAKVDTVYNHFRKENKGTRDILESLRESGINHETEIVQNLESNEIKNLEINNLKKIIMPLIKMDIDEPGIKESLNLLTGNQLVNKLEVNSNIQTMHLNVPYMANSKIESLDLYIHSKKESEKLDWKNTTIYFELNLKVYGKTGIKISANNKRLNMDIKNNNSNFKRISNSVFNEFLDNLADIGYIKGNLKYSRFSQNKKNDKEVNKPIFTDEGFDIKI